MRRHARVGIRGQNGEPKNPERGHHRTEQDKDCEYDDSSDHDTNRRHNHCDASCVPEKTSFPEHAVPRQKEHDEQNQCKDDTCRLRQGLHDIVEWGHHVGHPQEVTHGVFGLLNHAFFGHAVISTIENNGHLLA